MVHIELRDDDWFEVGKDDVSGLPGIIYQSKQQLKEALLGIGERSQRELETALGEVPDLFQFRGQPYVEDNRVYINTPGLPGKCYLGEIVE